MKKKRRTRSAVKKALGDPIFRARTYKARKGKGSYDRKEKKNAGF